MTKIEYDNLDKFPVELVTLVPYRSDHTNLKRGQSFMGVRKVTLGSNDYSIVDEHGHPHYYAWCDLLFKD